VARRVDERWCVRRDPIEVLRKPVRCDVELGGTFQIVNNFMFDNGFGLNNFGAVSLSGGANDIFEFNTLTINNANDGQPAGVFCAGTNLIVRNNIIYDNKDAVGGADQVGGNCKFQFNVIGPGGTLPVGSNVDVDPMFINTSARKPATPGCQPRRRQVGSEHRPAGHDFGRLPERQAPLPGEPARRPGLPTRFRSGRS